MSERRTRPKQVKFWTTEDEFSALKDKVYESKLTQNEYLIRCALEKNIIVVDGLKEVLLELSKQGNMLNELMKNESINEKDFNELKEKLSDVWGQIQDTLIEGKL